MEDAGHVPESFDGAIGVFAGCGMSSYFMFNLLTNPDLVRDVGLFLLRHTGNDKDFLATRASYLFDLRGPSVNVQTACSTSLVATHLACSTCCPASATWRSPAASPSRSPTAAATSTTRARSSRPTATAAPSTTGRRARCSAAASASSCCAGSTTPSPTATRSTR